MCPKSLPTSVIDNYMFLNSTLFKIRDISPLYDKTKQFTNCKGNTNKTLTKFYYKKKQDL